MKIVPVYANEYNNAKAEYESHNTEVGAGDLEIDLGGQGG